MDVRCDRCQTEYELDDDSVTDGGASVQCTTCGHTFVVGPDGITIAQIVPTPPDGIADLMGPQAADWLLATEDGQTHRFRDLTTLQKWVVERKATREDRVSQRGGPWRPLGDVSELAPFFDVVEQADRARSAPEGRRLAGRASDELAARATPTRATTVARSRHPGPRSNGFSSVDGSLSARLDTSAGSAFNSDDIAPEEEKFETMAIFHPQRGLKIAGVAGFVGLAVVAALIGFKRPPWLPFFKAAETTPAVVPAAPAVAAADPAADPAADLAADLAAGLGANHRPTTAAPAPVAAPPGAAPGAPEIDQMPSPPPPPRAPPGKPERAAPESGATGAVRGKSYERLVADADRLMENGAPVRAQKLLDEALAMQPNGVAALSGSAYLLLDRQKPLAAIGVFKRALGISPEFPPALFGLAEAYRAQGQLPLAAENYRKYIGVAPGGPDAPAARRQLKDIDSLSPRRPAPETPPAPSARENPRSDEPTAPASAQ